WDVGSVLAAYLTFWLWSAEQLRRAPPELFDPTQDPERESMKAALRKFWASYATARGLAGGSASGYLVRCVQFAAVRMITLTYEYLFNNNAVVTDLAHAFLRASNSLLGDPERYVHEYVGS